MPQTAIIIGTPATCRRIEQQLDLLEQRPVSLGWVVPDDAPADNTLGTFSQLEAIIATRQPGLALVSLPGAMSELITRIRTRLRRLGVPDRFMPTLEDQLAGVGPRTHIEIDLNRLLDRPARVIDEQAIRAVVTGRRVLVTGAGGSIGSELARVAAQFDPAELVLMDRSENALFEIDRQIAQHKPQLARRAMLHDVVEAEATMGIMRAIKPEVIFHAAAHKHVPMMEDHPAAAVQNNFLGTKAVLDGAEAVGAERFVLISTDKAVNPSSMMGMTKRLAELYVQHANQRSQTRCCIVRFGNVLGSSGSVLEIWARQLADGGPLTVTDPAMTRYFMTIPEAASLVIQAAALDEAGGDVYLLDMGEPIRVVELARRFAALHGLRAVLPDGDDGDADVAEAVKLAYTGIRPGEKLHEDLSYDAEAMRPTQHPDINIWCLEPPDSRYIDHVLGILAACRGHGPEQWASAVRRVLADAETAVAVT